MELAKFAGLHRQHGPEAYRRLSRLDGKLRIGFKENPPCLKPLGGLRFAGPASDLTFRTDPPGRMCFTETVRSSMATPGLFEAVEPSQPSPSALTSYVGTYLSNEVDPLFRISLENERLVLHRTKLPPQILEPLVRDVFRAGAATWRFTRGRGGRVGGAIYKSGGIRNFKFMKQGHRL
jgi:hypothetical protein